MKKTILFLSAVALFWVEVSAQSWQRLVLPPANPTSAVNGIVVGSNGNVVIAGFYSSSFADTVRFGNGVEIPYTNEQSDQGFLASYSNADEAQWALRMGGDFCNGNAYGVAMDLGNNIFVSGGYGGTMDLGNGVTLPFATSSGTCGCDIADGYVAKVAPDGTPLWAMAIGGNSDGCEPVQKIAVTPNGDVVGALRLRGTIDLDGTVHSADGSVVSWNSDALVFKLDTDGSLLWSTLITGEGDEWLNALTVGPDGDVLLSMKSTSTQLTCGPEQITLGSTMVYEDVLWSLNSSGVPQWAVAVVDGQNVDAAFGLDSHVDVQPAVTADLQNDNIYLTGSFSASSSTLRIIEGNGNVVQIPRSPVANNFLPYLLAFNSSGMLQWNELSQNSSNRGLPYAAVALPTGGLLVGGAFRNSNMSWLDLSLPSLASFPASQNTIFLLAVDQDGNAIGEKRGYIGAEGEINQLFRSNGGEVHCGGRACYDFSGNTAMDGFNIPLNTMGSLANLFYAVLDMDPVLHVGDLEGADLIRSYPNPTRDRLTIVSAGAVITTLELKDMAGRTLSVHRPMSQQWNVDLDNLPSGAYLLQITADGKRYSRMISKVQ